MPFPPAIAKAQRDSFAAQIQVQIELLTKIRAMLDSGEPHLFAMTPTEYFAASKDLAHAIATLGKIH